MVTGNEHVGGLVGLNYGGISTSYSTGSVSGNSDVGGLVGYDYYGIIITSFWDIESSGQATSAGGTGLTTAEMQDPITFMAEGWDFICQPDGPHDIWAEPEGGGYPVLFWQVPPEFGLPDFAGGKGEPNDPYLISTAEELNSIGHNPRLMKSHFKLTDDIDLDPNLPGRKVFDEAVIASLEFLAGWYGFGGIPFTGVFDGNGHTISNLMIEGESYLGLFGFLGDCLGLFGFLGDGAEVKDLGLVDVNITGSDYYFGHVGGLVGDNYYGSITTCYCTGTVTGNNDVGGLVGMNYGSITTSYSTCTVIGRFNVGGLVGDNGGSITSSYSTGMVTGSECIGGLVGENYEGSITTSYSTGTVIGTSWEVGGLVGYNSGSVTGSYSTSAVRGSENVGGLVGMHYGAITNCYSIGGVSGTTDVGGLVGSYNDGIITNCYSVGRVTGTTNIGGLIGRREEYFTMMWCFWDIQTSDNTSGVGIGGSYGIFGKTTAEMQTQSTFTGAGWDFVDETENDTEDIWWILEGKDYPRLWWEKIE